MIAIKNIRLSQQEIYNYFISNASVFIPPLESRVDVRKYSEKIYLHADQFWAFNNNEIIGFMACYFNYKSSAAYITTLSIIELFQNNGIGKQLIKLAENLAKSKCFNHISFEVQKSNSKAIVFHIKNKYQISSETPTSFIMNKKI